VECGWKTSAARWCTYVEYTDVDSSSSNSSSNLSCDHDERRGAASCSVAAAVSGDDQWLLTALSLLFSAGWSVIVVRPCRRRFHQPVRCWRLLVPSPSCCWYWCCWSPTLYPLCPLQSSSAVDAGFDVVSRYSVFRYVVTRWGGGTGLQFLRPTAANFRQKMYKAQNFNFVFKFLQNGALSALSFVFSNENFETKDRVFWRANI